MPVETEQLEETWRSGMGSWESPPFRSRTEEIVRTIRKTDQVCASIRDKETYLQQKLMGKKGLKLKGNSQIILNTFYKVSQNSLNSNQNGNMKYICKFLILYICMYVKGKNLRYFLKNFEKKSLPCSMRSLVFLIVGPKRDLS